jgi:GTPase KRas protein
MDGESVLVEVLHSAGMNNLASLQEHCIREGDAFVLVYSVCSHASFAAITKLHRTILRIKEDSANSVGMHNPVMVVGNQKDRTTERQVPTEEGRALAITLQSAFIETSAKSGSNVEKAFLEVVEQLVRQRSAQASKEASPLSQERSSRQRNSLLNSIWPWRSRRK